MVKLVINNTQTAIVGQFDPDYTICQSYHALLRLELSYEPVGVEWAAAYKEGTWDGKISVYAKRTQTFPTGCVRRVMNLFDELKIEYKLLDARKKPLPIDDFKITADFGGRPLRFYQEEAVKRAIKAGRGILQIATGGGKTMASCALIERAGVAPFVFFVPSISLLRQTRIEFQKYLRVNGLPARVGFIGGGRCEIIPDGINVMTVQTALASFDEKYQDKGNKIVKIEPSAEPDERKPTSQLQTEADNAKTAYEAAAIAARATLEHLAANVRKADYALEDLLERQHQGEKTTKKAIGEAEKAVRAAVRELEKTTKEKVETFKIAMEKTSLTLQNRIQGLSNKKRIRHLVENCKGIIVDEAHLASSIVEALGNHAKNAYYKWGLSATPWRQRGDDIIIEGSFGRKLIDISVSDLTELDYLVPAYIWRIKLNNVFAGKDYRESYKLNVVDNWERNYRIKQAAEMLKAQGLPVLILIEQKAHGEALEEIIRDSVFVAGGDKGEEDDDDSASRDYRRSMLDASERNEIILIATQWANVGIDAPRISAVVLGGSGTAPATVYQQVGRGLRCVGMNYQESIVMGKPLAIIVDFIDEHKNLHTHSVSRGKVYKLERAWKVKTIR